MGLQDDYDLENEKNKIKEELSSINPVAETGLYNAVRN